MSDLDEHGSLHRLLGGYLLGGLDEADTDRLDEHLRDCADCRAELDRLAPAADVRVDLRAVRMRLETLAGRPVSEIIQQLMTRGPDGGD